MMQIEREEIAVGGNLGGGRTNLQIDAAIMTAIRCPGNEASPTDYQTQKNRNNWFADEYKLTTKQRNESMMYTGQRSNFCGEVQRLCQVKKRFHRKKKEIWTNQQVCVVQNYTEQWFSRIKLHPAKIKKEIWSPPVWVILKQWIEYSYELLKCWNTGESEVPPIEEHVWKKLSWESKVARSQWN